MADPREPSREEVAEEEGEECSHLPDDTQD